MRFLLGAPAELENECLSLITLRTLFGKTVLPLCVASDITQS